MTTRRTVLLGAGTVGGLLMLRAGVPAFAATAKPAADSRIVAWGTKLDPGTQTAESRALARSLANPGSSTWRAKGDQHRSYQFPDAKATVGYRLYVPTSWDGSAKLPLVMFLHGSGSDENAYVDMNNKQLVTLAANHGYLLVAPLGYQGAYGSLLRLGSEFGQQAAADKVIAARTDADERTQQLSEKDVINVLELVRNEYPVDDTAMFLAGHSMGSGGTWYLGGKYASYWRAIAPLSGPFVQEQGYPWSNLRSKPIIVTEGTNTPTITASRLLRDWLAAKGFQSTYREVNADHGGMIPLVLPGIFDVFDQSRRS